MRLVESRETQGAPERRSRTQDDLPATAEALVPEGVKARIKLDSLPTALRAVVSDVSGIGITIEADLPWLAVGTGVHADCPDGVEYTARVQSFDIDVSDSGSARLRIFAALSAPDAPRADGPTTERHRPVTGPRLRRLLAFGLMVVAAVLSSSAFG